MLKKSLKISSQGYPVFLKLVDFIVINVTLIFSAHLLGLMPFNTIAILSILFSVFFYCLLNISKFISKRLKRLVCVIKSGYFFVRCWLYFLTSW